MITRKLDPLGRIVLPKPFRKSLAIESGDYISVLMIGDDIVIRRNMCVCFACGSQRDVEKFKNGFFCGECREILSLGSIKLSDSQNKHHTALS